MNLRSKSNKYFIKNGIPRFVKNQGYSDHLEMKKNKRNSFYFETTYDEIIKKLK